jgi:hypothetical protein
MPPHSSSPLKPKKFIICICGSCKHIFKAPPSEHEHTVKCPACSHAVDIPTKIGQTTASDVFRFKCSNCQQDYCVLSKYGGKKFTCLACKQPTGIPVPAAAPQPEALEDPEVIEEDAPMYQLQDQPEDERVQVPEYDLSRVQPNAGGPKPAKKPNSGESSVMSKLKIPLIALGAIAGFIIGFVIVSSLTKGGGESAPAPGVPIQSPVAISFAEENVRLLHGMKQKDVGFRFHDRVAVTSPDLNETAYALSLGDIDSVASEVTFSNVADGAEAYIVESVITYAGNFTRTVIAGICVGIEYTYDEQTYEVSEDQFTKLMSLQVLDADNIELYAIGETADYLITQLDLFVTENSLFSAENFGFGVGFIVGFIVVIGFILVCQGIVFNKAGEPGWAIIVPIYNCIVLARVAGKSDGMGLLFAFAGFIPFVGGLIQLCLGISFAFGVAETFGKGWLFGLGLAFMPFIFYPILAFTSDV